MRNAIGDLCDLHDMRSEKKMRSQHVVCYGPVNEAGRLHLVEEKKVRSSCPFHCSPA